MPVKDLYYQKYLKYKNKYLNLQDLNLQNQIGGMDKDIYDIYADIKTLTLTEYLSQRSSPVRIDKTTITDTEAIKLRDALETDKTVTQIDLSNPLESLYKISSKGAEILAEILKKNDTLTTFNIGFNNIGDDGAIALATALEKNRILTHIDLINNNIGIKGAIALAKLLTSNSTLMTLDIGYNNINDDGAIALATALTNNSTLTKLELIRNNIGDEGATALAVALKTNMTLKKIDLRYNKIDVKGATELANALTNSTLTNLFLDYNPFVRENEQYINNLISKNREHIPTPNKTLEIDLFWKLNNETYNYYSVYV